MATTTEQSNKALVLGRRFQRALMQADLHRPARRRCGCWPTSTFLFSGIVVGSFGGGRWSLAASGADDGARAIGADADVGFAWSGGGDGAGAGRAQPATGSSSTLPNSAAPTVEATVWLTDLVIACVPENRMKVAKFVQMLSKEMRTPTSFYLAHTSSEL